MTVAVHGSMLRAVCCTSACCMSRGQQKQKMVDGICDQACTGHVVPPSCMPAQHYEVCNSVLCDMTCDATTI